MGRSEVSRQQNTVWGTFAAWLGVSGNSNVAVNLLTLYLLFLWAVPSQQTIAVLGSVGRPALLWGLVCLAVWVWWVLTASSSARSRGRQPVRMALVVFLLSVGTTYALSQSGPLPSDEVSPAASGLLRLLSLSGVLLVAHDGLTTRLQLQTLLRRASILGGLFATLGLLQFWTGMLFIDLIQIPGMVVDESAFSGDQRAGFTRATATAGHPLEYAVVLTAVLPISIATGLTLTGPPVKRWWASTVTAVASLVSVSRSAIVGIVVATAVLVPGLPGRARRYVLLASGAMLLALYVAVPGLAGTLRGMFLGVGSDASTSSRTSAVAVALQTADNYAPWGRGFGTFLPRYYILDNQLLLFLVEIGIIGLVAFLALVVTAVLQAQRARRITDDPNLGIVAQALTAGTVAVTLLFAFFDAMSFYMAAGTLFLLLGLCGAVMDIASTEGSSESQQPTLRAA